MQGPFLWMIIGVSGCLAVPAAICGAPQTPPDGAALTQDQAGREKEVSQHELDPGTLRAILDIRRKLGPGVAEILARSEPRIESFDSPARTLQVADDVFRQALREQFAGDSTAYRSPAAEPLDRASTVGVLRLASRQLESAAADLEELEKYAQADRYRSSAQQLRQVARSLAGQTAQVPWYDPFEQSPGPPPRAQYR